MQGALLAAGEQLRAPGIHSLRMQRNPSGLHRLHRVCVQPALATEVLTRAVALAA